MSTEDLEISIVQSPSKDNTKQPTTIKELKKQKVKKLKKHLKSKRITRSSYNDDECIIIGSAKPSPMPKAVKKISKRKTRPMKKMSEPTPNKKDKIVLIQELVKQWQKDLKKLMESTVVMSKRLNELE